MVWLHANTSLPVLLFLSLPIRMQCLASDPKLVISQSRQNHFLQRPS